MSMTGRGGGIFYVPLLTMIGYQLDDSVSISQVIIALSTAVSFFVFGKNKVIDWKLILIAEPFTILFAFFGAYLSSSFSDVVIKTIFIMALIAPLILMYKTPSLKVSNRFSSIHKVGEYEFKFNYLLAIIISCVGGIVAGTTGIGGGVIKVPLFIGLCGIPAIVAIGSSTVMIMMTTLSTTFGQAINSNLDIMESLPFAAAAIFGNILGSKLSLKLSDKKLKIIIVVTTLTAIFMMLVA